MHWRGQVDPLVLSPDLGEQLGLLLQKPGLLVRPTPAHLSELQEGDEASAQRHAHALQPSALVSRCRKHDHQHLSQLWWVVGWQCMDSAGSGLVLNGRTRSLNKHPSPLGTTTGTASFGGTSHLEQQDFERGHHSGGGQRVAADRIQVAMPNSLHVAPGACEAICALRQAVTGDGQWSAKLTIQRVPKRRPSRGPRALARRCEGDGSPRGSRGCPPAPRTRRRRARSRAARPRGARRAALPGTSARSKGAPGLRPPRSSGT